MKQKIFQNLIIFISVVIIHKYSQYHGSGEGGVQLLGGVGVELVRGEGGPQSHQLGEGEGGGGASGNGEMGSGGHLPQQK